MGKSIFPFEGSICLGGTLGTNREEDPEAWKPRAWGKHRGSWVLGAGRFKRQETEPPTLPSTRTLGQPCSGAESNPCGAEGPLVLFLGT